MDTNLDKASGQPCLSGSDLISEGSTRVKDIVPIFSTRCKMVDFTGEFNSI